MTENPRSDDAAPFAPHAASRTEVIVRPVTCPVFVGRREELELLSDARRALSKSRGQIVLIGGDAGIGKSRLLAQFVRAAAGGRIRTVATAECLEATQRPFGPIRDWVATLLGRVKPTALPTDVLRALAHLAPEAVAPEFRAQNETVEKADVFSAIATLLKIAAAERATVLTVEDMHWADPSTVEVLAYLSGRIAGMRLLIVATYRSDEVATNDALSKAIARMLRDSSVKRIVLGALSAREIGELIAGALEGHATPTASVSREIAKQSEGNPFFIEELLKSAIERPSPDTVAGLPLSIRAGILERMGGLAENERDVVVRAAVLGYRFDPHVLALTMDCDVEAILPALRRARNLNIVVEEDGPQTSFRFRHALTRQTIYGDMLLFDARRLHEQILSTLETLGDQTKHLDQLAYHAWIARDATKTVAYNERAGDTALDMHGIPEARTYFERALGAVSDVADEARLLERVGHVAQLQGRSADALESYEGALALRRIRGEFDDAADLVRAIVTERNNTSDESALAFGDSFLAEQSERLSVRPRDALLAVMARLASARFDFEGVAGYLARIADRNSLPARARQNCLVADMELRLYLGDAVAWRRVAERLTGMLDEMPAFNAAIVLYTIAQCGTFFGANDVVERAFARAERLEQRRDFGSLVAFGAAVRGAYWFQRGRLDLARASLGSATERADFFIAQAAAAQSGPLVGLALGDDTFGAKFLDDGVIRDARREPVTPEDALIIAAHAAWWHARGRPQDARADARRALFAHARAVPSSGIPLAIAAGLLPEADLAKAEHLFDARSLREDDVVGRANVALATAIRERRFGDATKATALAREAAAAFRDLGWPLMEARALEAAEDVARAVEIFERCGARGDVRRLAPDACNAYVDPLTSRERSVADLVAEGLSNVAIAERLSVSSKTVEKYVSALFVKFGVRSRAQIAATVARERNATAPR